MLIISQLSCLVLMTPSCSSSSVSLGTLIMPGAGLRPYCSFQKHANSEVQTQTFFAAVNHHLLGNRTLLKRVQKVMVCDL